MTKECRPVGRVNNYELMVLLNAPPPKLTYCATLDKEWRADTPANQITVFLPANIGAITSTSILQVSSVGTALYRLEMPTIQTGRNGGCCTDIGAAAILPPPERSQNPINRPARSNARPADG